MREAVGGSILFYIILIFIFIYIVFIGVIMNYAATYRATNYVVNSIEQTEGNVTYAELKNNLKNHNYYNGLKVTCSTIKKENRTVGSVYKVETYVDFEIPLIGVNWVLSIRNDTKTIYGEGCNSRPLSS